MNVTPLASGRPDRRVATLVMACLGVFVAYLPVTTVSVSLPAIQAALGASTAQLSWVQDAFVLPMAAFILTAGVVGDVHGRKKVFQAGLLLSAVGAAVALAAQSIQLLWVGQALAGMGAAALLPTTLALISHAVPDHRERGKFIGLWATSLLMALAVGPLIAGIVLEHAAWRWIYLLVIPVSLIATVFAARLLTDSRAPHGRRLDWPGQITAAVSITALVYGVIEGGAGSFTDTQVLAALFVAVAGAVAFVVAERRSDSPMLDLTLFRSPAFTATTLVAMITFLGLIGFFFLLSLYFGLVQQLDTLQAAWRLLMVTGAAIVAGGPVARLMHRVPSRTLITAGLLVVSGALLSMTTLDADTSFASIAWRLVLLGLGMGGVLTPMTATAVASVPHHLAGMAAAGNNTFRQIGGALGPAVLGALLTSRALDTFPAHLADAGITGASRQSMVEAAREGGLGAVAGMNLGAHTGQALGAVGDAFLDGLRLCLIVAAALTLLAALVSAVLLRPRASTATVTVAAATPHPAPGAAAEAGTSGQGGDPVTVRQPG
ncbi:MFS transporter [Streptomyces sp. NBC_01022]|uniref:MFS transporter n=1 Tax=Streptomyces sp. NBC_01022 TaxID=2903723 RepID=UPI003FA3C511